jgi:hypothetical protein
LREKIVLTSSAVFPTCDITYLHSRVSQTYIATNQWGIELSSNAFRDIRNEYRYGEGEYNAIVQYSRNTANKVLKVENKKALIRKQLKENIINKDDNPIVKNLIEKIQTLLESGELPDLKDGHVSETTLKRQKEESEREELEEQAKDEDEDD